MKIMKSGRWILVVLLAVFLGCVRAPGKVETWRLLRVVDGDTLRVQYRGRDEAVRLLQIDTPERGEWGFRQASDALGALVQGRRLRLEWEGPAKWDRDHYGRLLAYVFADGLNVNVEMVRLGWSPFWTKYGRGRYAEEFRKAEAEARAAGRGVWGK